MKLTKSFLKFLKKYCTGASDLTNSSNSFKNIKTTNEISVFKTITNNDILNFAKLTDDYNSVHMGSSNNLVHGAFLNGLVSGVIGTKVPGPGTIVIEQNLIFPKPCYAGEKIEIRVQIISLRKIIKCEYICIANEEKIVLKGEAKLIKKVMKHDGHTIP
ncbi:hydroxyacyl-thioester dehydratase type 2, mitochondrial-like [Ptiloglossa arizonensis]|uniref:hydroxyacyl-thioester dehydratase type 2, mitochondrial-like n=1 Tax=Ptiloglossa arizonensis TaxID=3350558 RepID=UPI003F9F54DB